MSEAETVLCMRLAARLSRDRRIGVQTSEAAQDYVRATCPCPLCIAWRERRKRSKCVTNKP